MPMADIFNHKASVLALSSDYNIAGDGSDSGDESGSGEEASEASGSEGAAEGVEGGGNPPGGIWSPAFHFTLSTGNG